MKLLCHWDVVCFVLVERFDGLTSDFAGVFGKLFCKWLIYIAIVIRKMRFELRSNDYTHVAMKLGYEWGTRPFSSIPLQLGHKGGTGGE